MLTGGVPDAVAAMTRGRVQRAGGPRRRRAGRSAAELARTARRDAIRQSLPQLAIASAILIAVGAGVSTLILVSTGSAWWSGFLAGLMAGALALLVQTLLVDSGAAIRGYGVDAERWTAEKLDTLDQRQ